MIHEKESKNVLNSDLSAISASIKLISKEKCFQFSFVLIYKTLFQLQNKGFEEG